ncbi:MAG: hypothetical protein OXE75_16330 [bacterium]|nr:hypothetical protein [bacterium]
MRDQAEHPYDGLDPARKALRLLVEHEPERHDLIFGLVGAIGVSWDPILRSFDESLQRFGYSTQEIHIARLTDELEAGPWGTLPDRASPEYYRDRMDACDQLRSIASNGAAMAALGIRRMSERRYQSRSTPTAYFLRSLKHPDEVKLLRHVYGEAFFLVATACTEKERRDALAESLSLFDNHRALAEQLLARDEADSSNKSFGQNVRDTYSIADVFVPSGRGINIKLGIDRYIDAIFGGPFVTPSPSEEGMRFAFDASLRSAAAGRQVGAALIPRLGTPVVAGTNEVPKPGGGQYWTDDNPDYRDFKTGQDPNPIYTKRVVQEMLERLAEHGWLIDRLKGLSGEELLAEASMPDESGDSLLTGARASALIEFTRCLHAEQAAIINSARSGVSTEGAILYTTTFPCHECAKMIIGAGIVEVQYIEPYPKSLVGRLYRDVIETSPPFARSGGLIGGKLPFHQFLGIAPRFYTRAFAAGERRIGDSLVEFNRPSTAPRTSGWNAQGIEERESAAIASISRILDEVATNLNRESLGRSDDEPSETDSQLNDSRDARQQRESGLRSVSEPTDEAQIG